MNTEQFKKIEELFFELRPLEAAQRSVALASRCADDPDVRAEVEKLLEQDGGAAEELSRLGRDFGKEPSVEVTRQLIGQRVGCYEVLDVIGQGGMGVIYRARDVRLSRPAALKAILPGAAHANATRLERLRREARVLASISHPNIATIYGLEESHDTLFIAMELVEGKTLSQRLGRGAMPVPEALAVCEEIAAGVEAAHEAGVIHRDLKPGNVMFTADGAVKVLDFGLAREMKPARDPSLAGDETTRAAALTRNGSFFGTPAYMSPEQARGESLDRRSDIFSFGSIVFRCLTGRPAFDGEGDAETIDGILHREPELSRLPANAPRELAKVLRRCLAKDPNDRYRDIGDVRLELRDMIESRAWEARDDVARGGRPAALPWVVAALCALVALTVALLPRRRGTSPPAATAARVTAQRLDLALPGNVVQRDLERLQLAVARDGRFIVAPFHTASGQELWIRELAGASEWRRIDGTLGAHRPFLSPDGQWVGFHRDGHLYKRRLSGGESIRIVNTTNWYGAAWAAGDTVVYTPTWGDPIHAVAQPGGAPVVISRIDPAAHEYSHLSPMALPGGRWVLCHVWHGKEECSMVATEVATRAQHTVIRNATSARFASTPRGDYLLFERASIIFAAPFDPAAARVTGPETPVVEGVMNDGTRYAAYFDVADDGTLAYVPGTSFQEENRLCYVNPDGTTEPLNDERLSFAEPVFSQDGSKLAVALKGKLYQAVVYDLERNTKEPVLSGGGDTVAHVFSPDGQTIACTINRMGGYGIDLISLRDGTWRRITPARADYQSDLDWSNDGRYLTFSMSPTEGAARDVWVVEIGAKDESPRQLIATPGADVQPALSPDGRWVAYASNVSGRMEVYLEAFPQGGRVKRVSPGGGKQPVWSPDGKLLYYLAPEGLVSAGITADGGVTGPASVVYDKPFGQSDPIARDYTIAPDGRPLIVEPSERRPGVSHLRVVTNWHQLLK